jgi:adenosylcobyric acid synthase
MAAKTLMVMGTGSSVGKSLLTAGLCRLYARRGMRVAPFKAQNMSNNAAVCADGAEIGRAQAVQARACYLEPSADMNPVLLKPEGHTRSQVIVLGKPWDTLSATSFYERKSTLWSVVIGALDNLRATYDLIVIEGAGSPVELNLKESDIVNMAVARHAQSPVVLVGDIDKGGIFAQLLGTLWLLAPEEKALVRGLIVNKFRGDATLFHEGVRILEERGQIPVLGIVPYLSELTIPEEDAVALDAPKQSAAHSHRATNVLDIVVVRLPHIANFDDFDDLAREPGVRLRYVQSAAELNMPAAIIVPGTKTTMADLAWLRGCGLDTAIKARAAAGTSIVGICGGFQMLGEMLRDPENVESDVARMPGLGLLPLTTQFARAKITQQVTARVVAGIGWLETIKDKKLEGYEIHMGRSSGGPALLCVLSSAPNSQERLDGAVSPDGKIWGCYLHGLFANDAFRAAWLGGLAIGRDLSGRANSSPNLDASLDRLADVLEKTLNIEALI